MPRYLINDNEAAVLRKLVHDPNIFDKLGWDLKKARTANYFPFRFKLLETMGATTPNKALAQLYYLGQSTASSNVVSTDYVSDPTSDLAGATSGTKGVCLASSEYFVLKTGSTAASASADAKSFIGTADTNYADTSTSVSISNLEPMDGASSLTTITARNRFQWNVISGGWCYVKYNNHTSGYDLIQTLCT